MAAQLPGGCENAGPTNSSLFDLLPDLDLDLDAIDNCLRGKARGARLHSTCLENRPLFGRQTVSPCAEGIKQPRPLKPLKKAKTKVTPGNAMR